METFKKLLSERDRFAAHCGVELLEVGPGTARAKMDIQPYHLNGHNIVHGAALFTLADLVFAAASNVHGQVAVAINISITFMKAAAAGTVYGTGREVSRNNRLGTYQIDITDENGDLLATFQGLAYRKKETHDWWQGPTA